MMKKIAATFLILSFFILPLPTIAAVATPSSQPSETVDKIKDIVKENLEKTEDIAQKETLTKTVFGQTGLVKTVGTKNITLDTDMDLLQVLVTDDTSLTKQGKEIKTSSIAIGEKLLVIGQKNKENVLEAKVINVLEVVDENQIVISNAQIAKIDKIDTKKKTFTLTINDETSDFVLSKKNTVKLDDFQNGDTILGIVKKYQGKFSLAKAVKL